MQIEVGDVLDIACVGALHKTITGVFDQQQSFEINIANLQRVDGAGMQLLTTLCRDAAQQGKTVTWTGTSEILQNAAKYLGLSKILGLPQ